MSKENSTILKANLEIALLLAIELRGKEERAMNYQTDSALVSGWKENLKALKNGTLEIK